MGPLSKRDVIDYYYDKLIRSHILDYPVWGIVDIYGKTVVHHRGFRTERVVINKLLVTGKLFNHADHLEKTYQCEVVVAHDRNKIEKFIYENEINQLSPKEEK